MLPDGLHETGLRGLRRTVWPVASHRTPWSPGWGDGGSLPVFPEAPCSCGTSDFQPCLTRSSFWVCVCECIVCVMRTLPHTWELRPCAPVVRLPPLRQNGLLEKEVSISKLCGPVRRHTIAFVVCSSPPPQWKTWLCFHRQRLLSTDLSFLYSLHLASPFLLFGTKALPPETVASCLQYRKAWPLDLEKAMLVSSFWNLILETFYWPGGLRGHCLLFAVNRTFA